MMLKRYAGTLVGVLVFFSLIVLQGCEGKDENIPAYIKINGFNLSVNPTAEGTASNKITDAWVYCDGSLLGVYELPVTFPVLLEGSHDFIIKAGIKMNGISASRGYYPFYMPIEQTLNLVPGETIELNPTVSYYPNKVQYIEGFEDGGISFESLGTSDTNIQRTSDPDKVFEGSYSGIVYLNSDIDYAFFGTTSTFDLPTNGTPVFLEMNYKTSNAVAIGLIAYVSGDPVKNEIFVLNPNSEWNKIYINLTACASSNQSASDFRLYFEMYKDANLTESTVLLDNLKLVYNE